jgi:copper chaperone
MTDTNATAHVFKVSGMSCQHCVKAVTAALEQAAKAPLLVSVDLPSGTVSVQGAISAAAARSAIEAEGYTVA